MGVLFAALHSGSTVLADEVSVDLSIEGGDPAHSRWHGSFRVGPGVPLAIDSTCTLLFADGRRGEILITRLAYGGRKDDVRVHFRGTGRLEQG